MIVHKCQQGTTEWLELRAGIPTASAFDRIITKSGKPSSQAEKYLYTLLAERIMGHPVVEHVSMWMQRGSESEADAVAYYELQRECSTEVIGFVTNDEGTIGASPDRFVGADGLLEIKVPKESTHVGYRLKESVDAEYYPQVQGQLWVTGRAWADIMSYHPEMPAALIHVPRDEKFIDLLSKAVLGFSFELESRAEELKSRGWIKPKEVADKSGGEWITDDDVAAILGEA
jgi:hypothetical protein